MSEINDEDRETLVTIAGADIAFADFMKMSASEAGMFLLAAMEASREGSWSAGNLGAHANSSLHSRVPRVGGRPRSDFSGAVPSLISNALAWLISGGLVGPGAWSSGASSDWVVTAAGQDALARGNSAHVDALRRLHADLHPLLTGATLSNFERGEYEVAVFAAFRAVEVALRDAAGLDSNAFGRSLVTDALRPGGAFAITADTSAEQEGFMHLFLGAMTAFKNPSSHRVVEYEDPAEAADLVHLADLLLRILDRERRGRERLK